MDKDQETNTPWENLPIRCDRNPNEINGVSQLLDAVLNRDHPMNHSNPKFYCTEFGSVNGDGKPSSFSSPILGMKNPNLAFALEPNIAPLVKLIGELGLITYSSCEGHSIDRMFCEAYAGILFLEQKVGKIDNLLGVARKEGFAVYRTWLTDVEDGEGYPTVEVYFPRREISEIKQYHEELSLAISRLASLLRDETEAKYSTRIGNLSKLSDIP